MPGPIFHHFLKFLLHGILPPGLQEKAVRLGNRLQHGMARSPRAPQQPTSSGWACLFIRTRPVSLEGRSLEVEWGVHLSPWSRRRI